MIQKTWFSVETLKDGSIGKVCEVEAKGRNGSAVRFYEAIDAADACSQAAQWYARHQELERESSRRRRSRHIAAGECTARRIGCTKKPAPGCVDCAACKKLQAEDRRKIKERRKRGDVSDRRLNPLGASGVRDKKRDAARRRKRMLGGNEAVLRRRILSKLDELSPGEAPAFRSWLVSTIPAMQPQPDPGSVRIPPGKRAKQARVDWFESSPEKAAAAE